MYNLFYFLKNLIIKGFFFLGDKFPKLHAREVILQKDVSSLYSFIVNLLVSSISFILTFLVFYLFFLLIKGIIHLSFYKLFSRLFSNDLDNQSSFSLFFKKFTSFSSYLLSYIFYFLFFPKEEDLFFYFHKAFTLFLIWKGSFFLSFVVMNLHYFKFLKGVNEIVPLTGLLKLISFLVHAIAIIATILVLFNITLTVFLATLGTVSAVTLLIFQKNILNIYSIFIFYYEKMVKEGDWIESSSLKCNGIVTSVGFNIIKVRNFDTSISSFSPSDLIVSSFKNWSYLDKDEEGLRTKQVLWIDEKSIKNLTEADIKKIEKSSFFKDFLGKTNFNLTPDLRNLDLLKSFLLFYFNNLNKKEEIYFSVNIGSKLEKFIPIEIIYISHSMSFDDLSEFKSSFIKISIEVLPILSLVSFQTDRSFFSLE